MSEQKILKSGYSFGTKAIDTYDSCCDLFGFKPSYRGSFASQKPLYAHRASKEGYGVWMLAHSSLNESFLQAKKRGSDWHNMFGAPDELIKEFWFRPSTYVEDNSIRITFAKTKQGVYVFKGVYQPVKADWEIGPNGKMEWVRTFKRISTVYPMDDEVPEISIGSTFVVPPVSPQKHTSVEITSVIDKCQIVAHVIEENRETKVNVDVTVRSWQKSLIGKKKDDTFKLPNVGVTYKIKKILIWE